MPLLSLGERSLGQEDRAEEELAGACLASKLVSPPPFHETSQQGLEQGSQWD